MLARTSPSEAGPMEMATRSWPASSAPSNSIPVLLRIAVNRLDSVEFTALTVSIPLRKVTCGGTGGISEGFIACIGVGLGTGVGVGTGAGVGFGLAAARVPPVFAEGAFTWPLFA